MQLTRKWVLSITGSEWPLAQRRVLGRAVRVRNPYIDVLSLAQVRALRAIRIRGEEMAAKEKADYLALILSTVNRCFRRSAKDRDKKRLPFLR